MDIASIKPSLTKSFDVHTGQRLSQSESSLDIQSNKKVLSQADYEALGMKYHNEIQDFDKFSEDHINTLNTPMTGLFRVDGVLVAATFGKDMMANVAEGSLQFPEGVTRNFQNVKAALEKIYGDRLEVEEFTGNNLPVLRDFDHGDFFTEADLNKGWRVNKILTDQEFEQAVAKLKGYTTLGQTSSAGFKAKG